MKYLLLIALCYPFTAFSQLDDYYSNSEAFTSQFFDFHSDYSFKFGASWCTGGVEGQGHYSIKDTVLTLQFEADLCDTDVKITPVSEEIGNIVFFDIRVYDKKNPTKPMRNVDYKIKTKEGRILLAGRVDSSGHFNIKMTKDNEQKTLVLSSMGPQKNIALICDKNYLINANISGSFFSMTAEAEDEIKYEFSFFNEDCKLYLRCLSKEYYGDYWGFYSRKEK